MEPLWMNGMGIWSPAASSAPTSHMADPKSSSNATRIQGVQVKTILCRNIEQILSESVEK